MSLCHAAVACNLITRAVVDRWYQALGMYQATSIPPDAPMAQRSRSQDEMALFTPSHQIDLSYPCPSLLADIGLSGDSYLALPVSVSRERYEPLPLIEDKAVMAHTDRANAEETRVYSLTKATRAGQRAEISGPLSASIGKRRCSITVSKLINHVRLCATYVGRTSLEMVTYTDMSDEDSCGEPTNVGIHPSHHAGGVASRSRPVAAHSRV